MFEKTATMTDRDQDRETAVKLNRDNIRGDKNFKKL